MMNPGAIVRDRQARCRHWRRLGVYADFTYREAIAEAVRQSPALGLVFHARGQVVETTLAQMDEAAERVAAGLYRAGLRQGDRLAVMLPSWQETCLAYLAGFKLGLAIVPIIPIYGPAETGFILRQSRARAVILPDQWRGRSYPDLVASAGPLPDLNHVILVRGEAGPGAQATGLDWGVLADAPAGSYPVPEADGDAVCLIVYTSGTTSDPKGVLHTHNTMLCDLIAARSGPAAPMMPADPDGAVLAVFPAGHIAGFLAMMRPFTAPTSQTVFIDQWVPEEGARLIERYRVAATVGTPVFLTSLMEAAARTGRDISSLRRFSLGATSITPENIRATDRLGFPGGRTYGMSEHVVVSTSVGESFEKRAYTDGRITPRNEVRILGEDGADMPAGQEGEILTRGPRLFMGYADPRLDEAAFLPGGWFRTGDMGTLDADGFLTVTGRKKDIIIRGGENISAKQVEDALASLPGVIETAVTAMPDPVLGEKVCAFIVAGPDARIDLALVGDHLRRAGLARQKTPERIVLVSELPRTASGKVRKDVLRARLRQEADLSGSAGQAQA